MFGEESNKITNKNGVVITITLGPTVHDTCNVLSQILIDHESAAGALAECVHAELLKADTVNVSSVEGVSINQSSLGLWIDPIGISTVTINNIKLYLLQMVLINM